MVDAQREQIEQLIAAIEEAAEMATQMPVQLQNGNGVTLGLDTFVGIPAVYWNAVVAALNEYVEELDA